MTTRLLRRSMVSLAAMLLMLSAPSRASSANAPPCWYFDCAQDYQCIDGPSAFCVAQCNGWYEVCGGECPHFPGSYMMCV